MRQVESKRVRGTRSMCSTMPHARDNSTQRSAVLLRQHVRGSVRPECSDICASAFSIPTDLVQWLRNEAWHSYQTAVSTRGGLIYHRVKVCTLITPKTV